MFCFDLRLDTEKLRNIKITTKIHSSILIGYSCQSVPLEQPQNLAEITYICLLLNINLWKSLTISMTLALLNEQAELHKYFDLDLCALKVFPNSSLLYVSISLEGCCLHTILLEDNNHGQVPYKICAFYVWPVWFLWDTL